MVTTKKQPTTKAQKPSDVQPPKKSKSILIRVSIDEHAAIDDAAWTARKRLSEFVRDAALASAAQVQRFAVKK
jgi:uncharacterized protein (DUF1778 family)